MMHDHDPEHASRREQWRALREAKRNAWRARRAARRAMWHNQWAHWGDPKFWGLDAESMRGMGLNGTGMNGMGMGASSSPSEVAELKAMVAEMEKLVASLSQRVIVLEKLATDPDAKLAAEIEKLRDSET